MFGSFSNWIAEKTEAMPTMSAVNMPEFLKKKQETTNSEVEKKAENSENVSEKNTENGEEAEKEAKSESEQVQETKVESEAPAAEGEEKSTENGSYKGLESAKEMTKNMGSMLFSFGSKATSNMLTATTSLKDVIQSKSIIGDFTKENEMFINMKKDKQRKEDAAIPPWVGYNEEEKLKEQILELSTDSRNFLRPPPTGVDFQFDFNKAYPVAMAILEEDPALSEMRFKLVPKQVKEENFWLNYFYRVSLIKQSTTFEELEKLNGEETKAKDSNSTSNETSKTTKQDTLEFVSDSIDHDLNEEDIKNELKQLNLENKTDDIDDWEVKPEDMENISAEELEKEINSMLD